MTKIKIQDLRFNTDVTDVWFGKKVLNFAEKDVLIVLLLFFWENLREFYIL